MHECDRWDLEQHWGELAGSKGLLPPGLAMTGGSLALLLSGSSSCRVAGCSDISSAPAHHWLLSKHRPDVQILRLCLGRAQCILLFLEIITDLLEKQETLRLLVCILTFLFLFFDFLSSVSGPGCLEGVAKQRSPASLLLAFFACQPSSPGFPFDFCSLLPQPQGLQGRWVR